MKKGFTLVEIIISISLILIIGVSITFFTFSFNKKSNNELEGITREILEAANLYVKTEIDDSGELYVNKVLNGSKGVQISLQNLVDKGYIDENIKISVYNSVGEPADGQDYFIMFLKGEGTENNYCDDGSTIILASWTIEKNKDIFLCDNSSDISNNILEENENTKMKVSLNKFAVSKEYYDSVTDVNKDNYLTYEENGVFTHYNESSNVIYTYYRGAVNNNFVKLGNDSEGKDLYWRILWASDNNKMKLVLDDEVPIYITNKNGNKLLITPENNTITNFHSSNYSFDYTFFKYDESYNSGTEERVFSVNGDNFLNSFIDLSDGSIYSTIYKTKNNEWYNNTNLKDYNYILKTNNFCENSCYEDNGDVENYYPSTNFDCVSGHSEDTPICNYKANNISSPVGFLTYGDVIRAGISASRSLNLLNSGNYLIKSNNQIITSDEMKRTYYTGGQSSYYYYGPNGIKSGYLSDLKIYGTQDYYTLINATTNEVLVNKRYDGSGSSAYTRFQRNITKFLGTVLKPVIVLNTTNIELSNALGTKEEPYEIIAKV